MGTLHSLQISCKYGPILKYKSLFFQQKIQVHSQYAEFEYDQSNFRAKKKKGDGPGEVMESSPQAL